MGSWDEDPHNLIHAATVEKITEEVLHDAAIMVCKWCYEVQLHWLIPELSKGGLKILNRAPEGTSCMEEVEE